MWLQSESLIDSDTATGTSCLYTIPRELSKPYNDGAIEEYGTTAS